jgi:hypothetical protein
MMTISSSLFGKCENCFSSFLLLYSLDAPQDSLTHQVQKIPQSQIRRKLDEIE